MMLATAFAQVRACCLDPALRARGTAHLIRMSWAEAPFARVDGPAGETLPVSSY